MKKPEASRAKRLARRIYSGLCGARVWANGLASSPSKIAVHYGGARTGGAGGPRVKVRRLREFFPEAGWGFNLVYTLSSAPYLSGAALARLRRRGTPIVHNQNGTFFPAWYGGDWRAENRRMARAFHAADHVFFQSEYCRRAAHKHLGERDGTGEILYNAVDTDCFTLSERKPEADGFKFLLTGKIDQHLWYRVEQSIRGLRVAIDIGGEVILIIAGLLDADVRVKADELIQSLSLTGRVKFAGPYTQSSAPSVYQMADAYIMMKHQDPCPNVVIEALSTGLPVLFSNSGGVAELVGARAGIGLNCEESWEESLAPSPEDIGKGMINIIADHEQMKIEARQRAVSRFGIHHWIQRHCEVFTQLLNSKP